MSNYKFFVQQIDQQNRKAVLVGCIPFRDLNGRVKYSFRDKNSEGSYQRRIDTRRAKGIADYIKRTIVNGKDDLPVFPTSIILAFNNDDFDSSELRVGELFEINDLPEQILIVDGQHRFEGMRVLNDEMNQPRLRFGDADSDNIDKRIKGYIESYRFNCCILLNYDLWEQAQIFATVNFNQKKVNKSLFYDIYGIKAPEKDGESISKQNEIYLAHRLVKFLNESESSPLKSMVKMLGNGEGYISQAFLVEQFLRLLGANSIWGWIAEDYRKGSKRGGINVAAIELAAYFNAIKRVFSEYWPSDGNAPESILYKTTGIGAMTRFLYDLHNQMDNDLQDRFYDNPQDGETYKELIQYFKDNLEYISPEAPELFGTGPNGKYKGSGGTGSQSRLYREICKTWLDAIKNGV